MKQTSVEWLEKQIQDLIPNDIGSQLKFKNKVTKAKEMEKQQITEAHFQGVKGTVLNLSEHIDIPKTLKTIEEIENGIEKHEEGEDYYNETFKK